MLFLYSAALAAVLVSSVTDLIERRILNALTLPLMVVGIAYHAIWPMASGSRLDGVWGLLAVGAPFFILHIMKVLAPGDVKLMMGIGALLGPQSALRLVIFVVLCSGFISLVAMISTKRMGAVGGALRYLFFRVTGKVDLAERQELYKIPMGVGIAMGVVIYLLLEAPLDS